MAGEFDRFQNLFFTYVREWQRLEREYYRIPDWRMIKQMRNINKRSKLTKQYIHDLKEMGIIL